MRKQAVLLLTIIAIFALTVTLSTGNVYAAPTVSVSPNPINPGTPITITGSGFPVSTTFGAIIFSNTVGNCFGFYFLNQPVMTDGTGAFTLSGISTVGLTVGTYCIVVFGTAATTTLTVTTAAIPEYPFGVAVLAAFMIIGYGVIRRKTVTKQK